MKAILVDTTKCKGCEKCVAACVEANELNPVKADYDRAASKDGLSENRFLSILEVEEGKFARKSCMHCEEPSCVSACLVGGLSKTDEGAVVYDASKCIGCRYCMLSCPYGIPRYEWSKTVPYMKKCSMCYEKITSGDEPACVGACPYGAIVFGEREELIQKARKIIRSDGKYIDRIWGESSLGGASVLYVSDFDLSPIGLTSPEEPAIPELTEPLAKKTPVIGAAVGSTMIGLTWIINRRNKLAKENNGKKKN